MIGAENETAETIDGRIPVDTRTIDATRATTTATGIDTRHEGGTTAEDTTIGTTATRPLGEAQTIETVTAIGTATGAGTVSAEGPPTIATDAETGIVVGTVDGRGREPLPSPKTTAGDAPSPRQWKMGSPLLRA